MNQYIKDKKTDKIVYKKSFSKQELLMIKNWNRLSPYYRIYNLTNDTLQRAYNRVELFVNKEKFQLAIKYTIEALKNNIIPKNNSIGIEYWTITQESKIVNYLQSHR